MVLRSFRTCRYVIPAVCVSPFTTTFAQCCCLHACSVCRLRSFSTPIQHLSMSTVLFLSWLTKSDIFCVLLSCQSFIQVFISGTSSISCLNSWPSFRMEPVTSTIRWHSRCRAYLVLSIIAFTFYLNSFISRMEEGRQFTSLRLNVTSVLERAPPKEERSCQRAVDQVRRRWQWSHETLMVEFPKGRGLSIAILLARNIIYSLRTKYRVYIDGLSSHPQEQFQRKSEFLENFQYFFVSPKAILTQLAATAYIQDNHHFQFLSKGIILCVIDIKKSISIFVPIVKFPHSRSSLMQQLLPREQVYASSGLVDAELADQHGPKVVQGLCSVYGEPAIVEVPQPRVSQWFDYQRNASLGSTLGKLCKFGGTVLEVIADFERDVFLLDDAHYTSIISIQNRFRNSNND